MGLERAAAFTILPISNEPCADKAAGCKTAAPTPFSKMNDALRESEPATDEVLDYARRIAIWQIENIEKMDDKKLRLRPPVRATMALTRWLEPRFGEGLRVGYDSDAVDALAPEREAVWSRLNAATFLSVNEKRAAARHGAVEDGDTIGSSTL